MSYTDEQKALISGVIGTQILERTRSEALRASFYAVHEHLHQGRLDRADLKRIESALELVTPHTCQTCNKEGYRELIEALMATRLMLREATA